MAPDMQQAAAAGLATPPGAPAPSAGAPGAPPGWGPPPQQAFQPAGVQPPAAPPPGFGTPPGAPPGWGAPPVEPQPQPASPGPGGPEPAPQTTGSAPPRASAPPAYGSAPPAPEGGLDPDQVAPDAPRVLAGFLVSYEGNDLGSWWPVFQGNNLIGRKDAADGLAIEIDHPTTSSRHANLLASARPGRVKVEDLGSTNGTFVKEEKLAPGTRVELADGDKIRFGGYTAQVKLI